MNIEIIVGEVIAGIVASLALLSLNKLILGNKLVKEAQKLSGQMSKFKQEYPEFMQKPPEYVSSALGELGIEGIMQELGIDPGLLKNPLVKGLIEKYAPRVLESMNKNGGKSKTQETNLL